eukprot:COSAG05_NODE_2305_length_3249_cov_50.098730_2_plen_181_part_00
MTHAVTARKETFRCQPTDALRTLVNRVANRFGVEAKDQRLQLLWPTTVDIESQTPAQLARWLGPNGGAGLNLQDECEIALHIDIRPASAKLSGHGGKNTAAAAAALTSVSTNGGAEGFVEHHAAASITPRGRTSLLARSSSRMAASAALQSQPPPQLRATEPELQVQEGEPPRPPMSVNP